MAASNERSRHLRVAAEAAVVVGIAHGFAERVLFGEWIVPRYGGIHGVAPVDWAVMYLPVLLACIWLGARVRSIPEACTAGVAAGIVAALEKLALADAPGHEASLALVSPTRFWSIQLARMTLGFVVLIVVAHLALRRRPRP